MLPASVLSVGNADAAELRVLLWLASDLSLATKEKQLAKLADCDTKTVRAALKLWRANGVLVAEESATSEVPEAKEDLSQEPGATEAAPQKKLLQRAAELPNYTSTEIGELLEKRAGMRALVNEAQQIVGKMFNPGEINILVGMYDYLGLSEESILLLLAHCRKIGKLKMRAIEKYAISLVDRDITTPAALEEEFRMEEALHSFEGKVRAIFGMGSRALTSRESKMLRAWMEFGYDAEIVRRAYEITVTATNKPSFPYANSILERWHAEGLNTAEAIDQAVATGKTKEDDDDFFEAALQRSFREIGLK